MNKNNVEKQEKLEELHYKINIHWVKKGFLVDNALCPERKV